MQPRRRGPDDPFGGRTDELLAFDLEHFGGRFVCEHVAAVAIPHENRVRRMLDGEPVLLELLQFQMLLPHPAGEGGDYAPVLPPEEVFGQFIGTHSVRISMTSTPDRSFTKPGADARRCRRSLSVAPSGVGARLDRTSAGLPASGLFRRITDSDAFRWRRRGTSNRGVSRLRRAPLRCVVPRRVCEEDSFERGAKASESTRSRVGGSPQLPPERLRRLSGGRPGRGSDGKCVGYEGGASWSG